MSDSINNCRPNISPSNIGVGPVSEASQITGVTAPGTIGPKKIMFFTTREDAVPGGTTNKLNEECNSWGVSASVGIVDRANALPEMISDYRKRGVIVDDTQIFIHLHGVAVEESADLCIGERFATPYDGSALEALHAIRKPIDGKTCAAPVYITACQSGGLKFVTKLQNLHNEYKTGVCFLLASSRGLSEKEADAAMTTICKAVISAKNSKDETFNPEHVWSLLTNQAFDCMSMVVANNQHPLRVHANYNAKTGRDALIKRLDKESMVFIDDKRVCFGLTAVEAGSFHEYEKVRDTPYSISGDLPALKKYREALLKLKDAEGTDEHGPVRLIHRLAARSECANLVAEMEKSHLYIGLEGKTWWEGHDGVVELLADTMSDQKNIKRRDEKVAYLARIIYNALKHNDDEYAWVLERLVSLTTPQKFRELNKTGLFVKSQGDIIGRIEPVCAALAKLQNGLECLQDILQMKPKDIFPETTPELNQAEEDRTFEEILLSQCASAPPLGEEALKFLSGLPTLFVRDNPKSSPTNDDILEHLSKLQGTALNNLNEFDGLFAKYLEMHKGNTKVKAITNFLTIVSTDTDERRRDIKLKEILSVKEGKSYPVLIELYNNMPRLFSEFWKKDLLWADSDNVERAIFPMVKVLAMHSSVDELMKLMETPLQNLDRAWNALKERGYSFEEIPKTVGDLWKHNIIKFENLNFVLQFIVSAHANTDKSNKAEIIEYILSSINNPAIHAIFRDQSQQIWDNQPREICEILHAKSLIRADGEPPPKEEVSSSSDEEGESSNDIKQEPSSKDDTSSEVDGESSD